MKGGDFQPGKSRVVDLLRGTIYEIHRFGPEECALL